MNTRLLTTITVLLVTALMMSGLAFAQNQQSRKDLFGGPASAEEKVARMTEALGLDDAQRLEMYEVLLENEANRKQLREQAQIMLGPEICSSIADSEAAILDVLDEEQQALFLEHKQQRQEQLNQRAEERGGRGHRIGPPDCSEYEDAAG
jgi:hypothetical protein